MVYPTAHQIDMKVTSQDFFAGRNSRRVTESRM